ncbi:MAG: succinylglutamate desuccinylase/aspartoacylase family protein [Planctomycetota bacterium]
MPTPTPGLRDPAAPIPASVRMPMPTGLRLDSRVLADVRSEQPGPLVVALGGLHGNEPAGVLAAQRVGERLRELPLRGRFVALAGNLPALAKGVRFADRDLNRKWYEADLAALDTRDPATDSPEDRQQRELIAIIRELHAGASEPIIFIDLHSTSGEGAPFCCMADTLRNRRIAFALPVPLILGLEENIDGALLGLLSDMGHVAIVVEGGQHTDPWTTAFLESSLWLALVAAGTLAAREVPDAGEHYRRLHDVARRLPRFVEIRHVQHVEPADRFRMRPGFLNFQRISRGQVLADSAHGEIRASEGGRILMPLYQNQGEDGFFIARDVRRIWLALSGLLRRLRLDRLVGWLPGVSRHPDRVGHPDQYRVNPRIARWFATEVMHLFGYRRCQPEGSLLVFSRRRPDHYRSR